MRRIALPGTPLTPTAIGLGTGSFGTAIPEDDAFALMDEYVALGGNLVDTAHVYAAWVPGGAGASERTIGRWLAARGVRGQVILATKGAHHDIATYEKRMTAEGIREDLHESLDRLGTDRVDLYWLHRDDPAVPVGEVLGWLGEHVAAGRVGAIGCSNWTTARQREAAAWAKATGAIGFCAGQVRWSLAEFRLPPGDSGSGMVSMDAEMLAWHRESGEPVFAYSPQARGFFSGRYTPASRPGDAGIRDDVLACYGTAANFRRLAAAQALAQAHGCTANQVALAWMLGQDVGVCAIVGAHTVEQLRDSCGAERIALSAEELSTLARS
ncbi:MAG TPA: aldo/keto reductase [Phycisphaerae bacterium]|nr:aldo/keto reductase [Phycisphaerae bacterium]